jgi:hypothetical protein
MSTPEGGIPSGSRLRSPGRVYFWPHDHPAVASLRFPAYPPPHIEIYKAGSVVNGAQLAYADVKSAGFAKSCRSVGTTSLASFKGSGAANAAKITCRFSTSAELMVYKLPGGGVNISAQDGHTGKTILTMTLRTSGSSAFWSSQCSSKPVPGVS